MDILCTLKTNSNSRTMINVPEVVIRSEFKVESGVIGVGNEGEIFRPLDPKHEVLDIEASKQHEG